MEKKIKKLSVILTVADGRIIAVSREENNNAVTKIIIRNLKKLRVSCTKSSGLVFLDKLYHSLYGRYARKKLAAAPQKQI